ncbi:hypothetical protein EVAR_27534_1 [Eumeta japonica]|uniref:Uncharacterized protein n=1 Tax=Eumeta variegata TaxID=151549 RepID=A0A4C1W2U6_EUMVA|nr:hypothetical protein EVAR_27534_1 [Eumeta japonica]
MPFDELPPWELIVLVTLAAQGNEPLIEPNLNNIKIVAEEHGKQKAAYYAGWTAGYHHNRAPPLVPQRHHSLDQLDMLHRIERSEYAQNPPGMYSGYRYHRRDFHQPTYMSHHRPF